MVIVVVVVVVVVVIVVKIILLKNLKVLPKALERAPPSCTHEIGVKSGTIVVVVVVIVVVVVVVAVVVVVVAVVVVVVLVLHLHVRKFTTSRPAQSKNVLGVITQCETYVGTTFSHLVVSQQNAVPSNLCFCHRAVPLAFSLPCLWGTQVEGED